MKQDYSINEQNWKFRIFFKKNIKQKLKSIEKKRIKHLIMQILILLLSVILLIVIFKDWGINFTREDRAKIQIIGIFCIIIIWVLCYIKKNYTSHVKKEIFNKLFSFLGDFYMPEEIIPSVDYSQIQMIKPYKDLPNVDDVITGTYLGIPITIDEVKLTTTEGSGKNRRVITKYKGLIMAFKQQKITNAVTIIRDRNFKYPQNIGKEVKLEDIEFNKMFEISSDDQIEARYIITPSLMERLKKLSKKDIKIACCFQNNYIYIGIKTKKNMFEPPFYTSALNSDAYKNIILDLKDVLDIIKDLKLNENIGL